MRISVGKFSRRCEVVCVASGVEPRQRRAAAPLGGHAHALERRASETSQLLLPRVVGGIVLRGVQVSCGAVAGLLATECQTTQNLWHSTRSHAGLGRVVDFLCVRVNAARC